METVKAVRDMTVQEATQALSDQSKILAARILNMLTENVRQAGSDPNDRTLNQLANWVAIGILNHWHRMMAENKHLEREFEAAELAAISMAETAADKVAVRLEVDKVIRAQA